MPIQIQKRASYNGRNGVSVTTVNLISREALVNSGAGIATGGKIMPFNELLSEGSSDITIFNPYTGVQESFSPEELRQSFAVSDLDNSFIQIETRFIPDHTPENALYPSDLVEDMQRGGVPEDEIRKLLEWEQSIRSSK